MQGFKTDICTAVVAIFIMVTPAHAEVMRSEVAFNSGIGEKTATQPADGVEVTYQITPKGGDLDGCTIDIVEAYYDRDEGAWGFFDIQGKLACQGGGFSYASSGAWDGNGFHASGDIKSGTGSGDFINVSGRIVELGGTVANADNGTFDVSYTLVFDMSKGE